MPDDDCRPWVKIADMPDTLTGKSAEQMPLKFASAAQQHSPPPTGPILSQLARVNGRGGSVLTLSVRPGTDTFHSLPSRASTG